ncbi:hypothetical protein AB205_0014140, partial [Aquarana catesbeiana]
WTPNIGIQEGDTQTSTRKWYTDKSTLDDGERLELDDLTAPPYNEVFLTKFAMKIRVWIGLSEIDGDWKWVDGTPFSSTPKKWAPGQPDEFFGHGLGGGEDCVQFNYSGDWNDEHCTRAYRYICEKKAVQ